MDGKRAGLGVDRRRGRRPRPASAPRQEPILIAARRPDAPSARPPRRLIAASASPAVNRAPVAAEPPVRPRPAAEPPDAPESATKRAARIVRVCDDGPDDREKQRLRLVARLLESQGRGAISRAANDILQAGFDFPAVQDVQLQLLEHFDEGLVAKALVELQGLLQNEPPIKRPLFEQRLRRLEQFAEDPNTREAAAQLRRSIRSEAR